jgi:hypothetical protein
MATHRSIAAANGDTFSYNPMTDGVELNWSAGAAHNVWQRFYDVWSKFPGFLVPTTNPDGTPGPAAPVLSDAQATAFTLHPLGGVPLGVATDLKCGLLGYDGLYAVDGACTRSTDRSYRVLPQWRTRAR